MGFYIYWELSYLGLVSALIFPHQPYYAMLYCVPAGAYIILFILLCIKTNKETSLAQKFIAITGFLLLLIITIKGRDTLGDTLVNMLNFYHFEGLTNLVFLILVYLIKPWHLLKMNNALKNNFILQ